MARSSSRLSSSKNKNKKIEKLIPCVTNASKQKAKKYHFIEKGGRISSTTKKKAEEFSNKNLVKIVNCNQIKTKSPKSRSKSTSKSSTKSKSSPKRKSSNNDDIVKFLPKTKIWYKLVTNKNGRQIKRHYYQTPDGGILQVSTDILERANIDTSDIMEYKDDNVPSGVKSKSKRKVIKNKIKTRKSPKKPTERRPLMMNSDTKSNTKSRSRQNKTKLNINDINFETNMNKNNKNNRNKENRNKENRNKNKGRLVKSAIMSKSPRRISRGRRTRSTEIGSPLIKRKKMVESDCGCSDNISYDKIDNSENVNVCIRKTKDRKIKSRKHMVTPETNDNLEDIIIMNNIQEDNGNGIRRRRRMRTRS